MLNTLMNKFHTVAHEQRRSVVKNTNKENLRNWQFHSNISFALIVK